MPIVLTADICAHGLIASAEYLGYDPIRAVLAKRGAVRAAVTAAALAAQRLTGARRDTIARIFGVVPTSLARCERESTKAFDRACDAASQAMVSAGLDLSAGGLVWEHPVIRSRPRSAPGSAEPQPAAPAATLPEPPRIDHTDLIRAALAKRRPVAFTVVGVEKDQALLPPTDKGACHWPMGDPGSPDFRSCGAVAVVGRMYCPAHCKAAGQKTTPKEIEVVGRVAAPYRDPRADNAIGRQAAR